MADVNNKIRLQIVTQLDAAGIKATKEQIDALESGLRRAGGSAGDSGEKFGQFEKALGKLPGRLGEIGGKLGGLIGQATMVAGAFSTGVEIGNKIVEQMKSFGMLADPIKELQKESKSYAYELSQVEVALAAVKAEEMKRMEESSTAAEKALKKIDDQTAAYFRQASALKGIREAQGNGEVMQLERAKFEDMRAYSDAGYTEAAEQIGRYYDVVIEELKAKQQIAAFDRESRSLDRERSKSEEAYAQAASRAAVAKERQQRAEGALEAHRQKYGLAGDAIYTTDAAAKKDDMLEEVARQAARAAEKADEEMQKRAEKLDTVDERVVQRSMERANLVASGRLSVDRAAQAFDDYSAATGNPANLSVDQSWASDMLQKAADADQTQRDILAEVKSFGDRLERLLEVK